MRRDHNTIDLTQQKLRIADDVVVWPVRERGQRVYRLEIPSLHRFFRVGYEEYVFISMLDGETTVPQACGLAAAKLGNRAPTGKQAEAIQRWLLQNELAYLPQQGSPVRRLESPRQVKSDTKRLLQRLNPFWIKLPVPRADRRIRVIAERTSWCFSRRSVVIGIALMLAGLVTLVANWDRFTESTWEVFSPSNWVWLLVSWVCLKVLHETAHAIVCHRQGAEVREMGIAFVLFAPMAYVDVTSCWRMNSRWARMAVSAAGMFAECVVAAVAMLCWRYTESPQMAALLQNVILTASVSTLLFNANALMRFDGYYLLADLVEVSNLYSESMTSLKRLAHRLIVGRSIGRGNLVGWRRYFVTAYGMAAFVWKIVICLSLAVAASTLFAGAGVAIACLGIFLWFGPPLRNLARFGFQLQRSDPARFARAAAISIVTVVVGFGLVGWLPLPTGVTTAAVTRYLPETQIRSGADGFIRKMHVSDLEAVRAGDLLMELENRELIIRKRELEIAIEQNAIRQRQALSDHDASAQSVLIEDHRALEKQLQQVRKQCEGLMVHAHRDGMVIARDLSNKIGRYVREGDPLLHVAQPTEKEIVVVIHQDDVHEVRPSLGKSVTLCTANLARISGSLRRIEPRASRVLPELSLASTSGGPLAVHRRNDSDEGEQSDSLRLLDPHFQAHVQLAPEVAKLVPDGMRMDASFGFRNESLLSRLRRAVHELWYRAHDESK